MEISMSHNDDYATAVKAAVKAVLACEATEGDPVANAAAELRWERAERRKKMEREWTYE